ncbi:transglutaminase-like domain-containing protein [Candidatus Woesearchaeota archaeon]|nr:transglutaminase-like domain-containing protein [Candidatus Woesearchaeota archaeon]MBW3005957.1 transglutaminase-like domain-containing protein [Candidatus Woesearchaeota archaeon]
MHSLNDFNDFSTSSYSGDNNLNEYLGFAAGKKPKSRKWLLALAGAALLGPCVLFSGGSSPTLEETANMDVAKINQNYNLTLTERDDSNPFIIDKKLVEIIREETEDCDTEMEKAEAIYDWMDDNVDYSESRIVGYRNSSEVINDKKGICGEMAFLYITMARSVGLDAKYVSVDRDFRGKSVFHACAAVKVDGKYLLVDPAYQTFDIEHEKFLLLSDKEAIDRFRTWRKRK